MPEALKVLLKPKSLFPEEVQSDTIAGAILYAYSLLYGKEEVDELIKEKAFKVSSAFPWIQSAEGREEFLPKPLMEIDGIESADIENLKEFKKAKYIHQELFDSFVSGNLKSKDIIRGVSDRYKRRGSTLYPADKRLHSYSISSAVLPHNVINRLSTQSTEFFFSKGLRYKNSGVYFMMKTADTKTLKKLRASIELLSDRGIGGGVSRGQGDFCVDFEEFEDYTSKGEKKILLSMYSPSKEEFETIDIGNSYYSLDTRRGVTKDGTLRKRVMMFTPGSVIHSTEKLHGMVREVSGEPKTVTWGLFMGVGMNG